MSATSITSLAELRGSSRLLRVAQAAEILQRSPRTLRYHAKQGTIRTFRGFVPEEDVYRLKEHLEHYYKKPFQPGSRGRGRTK
jgi:hypothetical protein